jgi:hypothetical protein
VIVWCSICERPELELTVVGGQLGPGHIAALVRGEKQYRRGDLVDMPEPLHRHHGGHAVQRRLLFLGGSQPGQPGVSMMVLTHPAQPR